MLRDHLGLTSVTANYAGTLISRTLYKPLHSIQGRLWGEVRYQSGALPTKYTYTGQYSHTSDFGLMYYVARWYDPVLGRFAQADSLVPGAGNPLAWDRFAYALNSPVVYNDPSGHCPVCPIIAVAVVSAAIGVGIDYLITTQVFHEDYTWQDGVTTAVFSGLSGGTGGLVSAGIKSIFKSSTKAFVANLIGQITVEVGFDYLENLSDPSMIQGSDLAVDITSGAMSASIEALLDIPGLEFEKMVKILKDLNISEATLQKLIKEITPQNWPFIVEYSAEIYNAIIDGTYDTLEYFAPSSSNPGNGGGGGNGTPNINMD